MSQINTQIYSKLCSASCLHDIQTLAETEITSGAELSILFDAESPLSAFSLALKAVGKCIGLDINTRMIGSRMNEICKQEVVLVVTEDMSICRRLYGADFLNAKSDQKETFINDILSAVSQRIAKLKHDYPKATVLIQTLPSPLVPPTGIQDIRDKQGIGLAILRTNIRLIELGHESSDANVFLIGYHQYSTTVTRQFFDLSIWNMLQKDQQVREIHHLIIPAWRLCHWLYPLVFQRCKALALDLDDTLWAGTLAEDGLNALEMELSGSGYLHHRLQTHIISLAKQGLMVGFVTRNESNNIIDATDALYRDKKLIVKPATIQADMYKSKAELITKMCEFLDNIDPTSVTFIDNSDIEREIVAGSGIGCTIAPFPPDIHLFEHMFLHLPIVEKLRINDTDRERSIWYEETQKNEAKFDLDLIYDPSEDLIMERIVELIHKTNQFNLTTIRYTHDQIKNFIDDSNHHVFALRAAPVYQSIIKPSLFGVIIVRISKPKEWRLESVLMSCRYMALGLDEKALKFVAQKAREENIQYLVGMYIPSKRNSLVKNWYTRMNFIRTKTEGNIEYYRARVKDIIKRKIETATGPLDLESYLEAHIKLFFMEEAPQRLRTLDNSIEVLIPYGELKKGIRSQDSDSIEMVFGIYPSNEINRGTVNIVSFWIDKYCITNDQYSSFINYSFGSYEKRHQFLEKLLSKQPLCQLEMDSELREVKARRHTGSWPAIVPYDYARLYANWVEGRLPTEDEWEWAARGPDGRWFPWGNSVPNLDTVWTDNEHPGPVDTHPAGESPFGLRGMVGNVWQWCSTEYNNHPQYKGGDYRMDSAYWKRTTLRPIESAEHCKNIVGFRVVRDDINKTI